MSKRAHARITKVNAGHLSLISHPGTVTRIFQAARATGSSPDQLAAAADRRPGTRL